MVASVHIRTPHGKCAWLVPGGRWWWGCHRSAPGSSCVPPPHLPVPGRRRKKGGEGSTHSRHDHSMPQKVCEVGGSSFKLTHGSSRPMRSASHMQSTEETWWKMRLRRSLDWAAV